MKNNVKTIAVCAVTFALTAVLGLLPYVFLIPLLFTCVTRDWKLTLAESLFFGVLSLCYAYISPAPTPVSIAFMENPWLPIVPRLFVGLGCHGAYVLMRRAFRGKTGKAAVAVPVIVACAVGSLLNTGLIVPLLWAVAGNSLGLGVVWVSSTLISGAIELCVALAVVPPLAVTVGKALRLPDYVRKTVKTENGGSDSSAQEIAPAEQSESRKTE